MIRWAWLFACLPYLLLAGLLLAILAFFHELLVELRKYQQARQTETGENTQEGNAMQGVMDRRTALSPEPPEPPAPSQVEDLRTGEEVSFSVDLSLHGLDRRAYFSERERAALFQVAKRSQVEIEELRDLAARLRGEGVSE
jgi:hypothetical protein